MQFELNSFQLAGKEDFRNQLEKFSFTKRIKLLGLLTVVIKSEIKQHASLLNTLTLKLLVQHTAINVIHGFIIIFFFFKFHPS